MKKQWCEGAEGQVKLGQSERGDLPDEAEVQVAEQNPLPAAPDTGNDSYRQRCDELGFASPQDIAYARFVEISCGDPGYKFIAGYTDGTHEIQSP